MGFTLPGYYKIDPTGSNDHRSGKYAYCDNGWTYILRRMPDGAEKVNTHTDSHIQTRVFLIDSYYIIAEIDFVCLGLFFQELVTIQERIWETQRD